jgi:hypothetical protein
MPSYRDAEATMSKPAKIILGMATLWPVFYVFLFFGFVFFLIISRPSNEAEIGPAFVILFILHGITMLWIFALLAIYIYNLFQNDRVDKDKKPLWAIVLFMGSIVAMPIYWYLYIWPGTDTQPQTSAQPQ